MRSVNLVTLCGLALLQGCGGGGDGGVGKSAGSTPTDVQTTIDCQLVPGSAGNWTTPVQIGSSIFGSWSAVTLDDRTTLVLKQEQSVDPNELTLLRYNCRGQQIGSWHVASRPAATGDIVRPTLYSPVIKTDGSAAWILWRQYEPNDNNSDEVESAQIRRWTPGGGLSDVVAIVPRYSGSVTDADVDVAPDGSVVVAWLESVPNAPIPVHFGPKLAAAMSWSKASGWSAPVDLAAPDPAPRKDIDRIAASTPLFGQAAVAWVRQDAMGQMIEGVQLEADGKWSTAREIFRDVNLSPSLIVPMTASAARWKVVMDQTGSTTALWAWQSWDGTQGGISYNHRIAGEGWSGAQVIAPLGPEATMSVSIARNGFGAVAWRAGYDVAAVWFDHGGLIDGTYLSYEEPSMGSAEFPEVVVDSDGHIVAVWAEQFRGGPNGPLEVARGSRYSPNTGWSPNVTLSTDEAPTQPINVENSAAGMGSVIWMHGDISGGLGGAGVWLAPFRMSP